MAAFAVNARRVIPNNAFYLTQGQILTWTLAAVGSVNVLAEIAALSRFALLFFLIGTIISSFTTAVFARQDHGPKIVKLLAITVCLYLLAGAAILLSLAFAPWFYLSVLGDEYKGLGGDLVLVNVGSFLAGLIGVFSSVTQGRAWLKWGWVYIPTTVLWLLFLSLVVGFNTLHQAAVFTALAPATGFFSEAVMITSGYLREFCAPATAQIR